VWLSLPASPPTVTALCSALKYKVMLKWPDVLNLAKSGNPAPDRKVVKTDAEWREQLTDEEYHVTRQAGTECAFSSEMCSLFEPGIDSCLAARPFYSMHRRNLNRIPAGHHSHSPSRRMSLHTGLTGLHF